MTEIQAYIFGRDDPVSVYFNKDRIFYICKRDILKSRPTTKGHHFELVVCSTGQDDDGIVLRFKTEEERQVALDALTTPAPVFW